MSKLFDEAVISHKKYIENFTSFTEEEWMPYYNTLSLKSLSSGEIFCEEGQDFRFASFVHKGLFESFYLTKDGKKFIKKFYWEGQPMAPYHSLLTNTPSNITIKAIEPSTVLIANYDDIIKTHEIPVWARVGRMIAEKELVEREEREKDLLISDAKTRFLNFKEKFPHLIDRVPQKMIAEYLGISPVSLSRLKNQK